MFVAWRLTRPEYAAELAGEGNRLYGARWNSPGGGVVYASANLSLCVLEAFVHLPDALRRRLPEMSAAKLSIPDHASRLQVERAELPADLSSAETSVRCRKIGDDWLSRGEHLVLIAPSFVVPQEHNVMINPAHRLMAEVKILSIEPFKFDPRLAISA